LIENSDHQITRRNALASSAAVAASWVSLSQPKTAAADDTFIDMNAINAVRSRGSSSIAGVVSGSSKSRTGIDRNSIIPIADPPPLLSIRGGIDGKSTIKIPRVGYSFYKTPPEQARRCAALALRSGLRHLDVATDYGSNEEIAKTLKDYLNVGITGLDFSEEKPELLELLDATFKNGEVHAKSSTTSGGAFRLGNLLPAPEGSSGRRGRRDALFISHKLSNMEQSTDPVAVKRTVKATISTLRCSYLDMVTIHSPLTSKASRLESYKALLDLRDFGFIKSVGVCNYGVGPLQEILDANLDIPSVNQIELSPFNQHKDVVEWCNTYGVAVSCSAWSKLSSADGPTEGWDILGKLAQQKGMTKAQVLVRWACQKGYVCVPRSASTSKVERIAIAQNSYGGVNAKPEFLFTPEEMRILDTLDVAYPAGRLGRRDGWKDSDVTGPDWDPTNFI